MGPVHIMFAMVVLAMFLSMVAYPPPGTRK